MNDEHYTGAPECVPASVLDCRDVIKRQDDAAYWLKAAVVAEEFELSTMLAPSCQTVLWFLQGQRPRQLEDGWEVV